jgi:hypothetical protein
VSHDWQLRRKYVGDVTDRCAVCGALREGRVYRCKGHVRWHREEPPCGPKPVAVKAASKNVSRAAVAEVAAELRKKADEAHADAIAARDSSNDNMVAVCGARFVAYATAAEAIERVTK